MLLPCSFSALVLTYRPRAGFNLSDVIFTAAINFSGDQGQKDTHRADYAVQMERTNLQREQGKERDSLGRCLGYRYDMLLKIATKQFCLRCIIKRHIFLFFYFDSSFLFFLSFPPSIYLPIYATPFLYIFLSLPLSPAKSTYLRTSISLYLSFFPSLSRPRSIYLPIYAPPFLSIFLSIFSCYVERWLASLKKRVREEKICIAFAYT